VGNSDLIEGSFDEFARAYVAQLQYLNQRTLEALATLREWTRGEAIIVVMSDHGADTYLREQFGGPVNLDERFRNLFAAYTPGRSCVFGEGSTPINLFPRLLNAYLEAGLDLAPDDAFETDEVEGFALRRHQNPERAPIPCHEGASGEVGHDPRDFPASRCVTRRQAWTVSGECLSPLA
jgi:hypothetical protein